MAPRPQHPGGCGCGTLKNRETPGLGRIDADKAFVVSYRSFEGETSFESPVVHLAAGGGSE